MKIIGKWDGMEFSILEDTNFSILIWLNDDEFTLMRFEIL